MCGIFCEICKFFEPNHKPIINDPKLFQNLRNRGPNSIKKKSYVINKENTLTFCASVLWMQGTEKTEQPVEDASGVLVYNGDIFDETWDKSFSDTQLILNRLYSLEKNNRHEGIICNLKSLKGPFSLIYYDKVTCNLYFTRDRIGRNSLLFHQNDISFVISSVLSRKYKSYELSASHIHILNVAESTISLHSWKDGTEKKFNFTSWLTILDVQSRVPDEDFNFEHNIDKKIIVEESLINFIQAMAEGNNCKLSVMQKLLNNTNIKDTVMKLKELLEISVRVRLKTQPQKCKECIDLKISSCNHCTIGILFSGGLDCTILALLADKFANRDQPIDLINVAFSRDENVMFNVPDRLTGEQSYNELTTLCPRRKWVFRKVNVTLEELEKYQKACIADLIYPRQTILDESLGSALWFAARGQDEVSTSPCRVLLLGSGADELFGGYTRHRNAFKRCGWSGLQKELTLDWERIAYRNLARDNRVLCDHGRQPRMPYLDEDFTDYVLHLKPWLRCFPAENLGPGLGDKLMLRLLALSLGFKEVCILPKRALQFGSRIASKKDKGNDISKYFVN